MIQNAYIGLGSNIGYRAGYLLLAVRGMLEAGLDVIRLSNIYETQPVENENQPSFLNMVAELRGSNSGLPKWLSLPGTFNPAKITPPCSHRTFSRNGAYLASSLCRVSVNWR